MNSLFLQLLSFISWVRAFGKTGHELTAAIAELLLDPWIREDINRILPNVSLSEISTWADHVKRIKEYQWSAKLHYSTVLDDEPYSCSYHNDRDCPDGQCLFEAIKNYTFRYRPSNNMPKHERIEALKFLVHFMGDLHQPLHLSGRDRGGNNQAVYFFGRKTNMHSLWDGRMLDRRIALDFNGDQLLFLEFLRSKINASDPICLEKRGFVKNVENEIPCLLSWAENINHQNCLFVWKDFTPIISEDYYYENIGLIEENIIAAGIRLASILNSFY
jgi:hypothetical protein